MALNAIERRILIDARARLVNGSSSRICYAIGDAAADAAAELAPRVPLARMDAIFDAKCRLVKFIQAAIGGRFGFEDWVWLDAGNAALAKDPVGLRKARIAWIDWLLDEPWTDHNGGPCPLMSGEKVTVCLRKPGMGREDLTRHAETFRWSHVPEGGDGFFAADARDCDIVAYKVNYVPPTSVPAPALPARTVPCPTVPAGYETFFLSA